MTLSMDARRSGYPVVAGVIAGVLVAGLTFRLSTQVPSSAALGSGVDATSATTGTGGSDQGGASGRAPDTTPSLGPATGGSGAGGATGGGPATSGAGGSATSGAGGSSGSGTSNAPLSASDVGVTATEIKVGIGLLDLGASSSFVAIPGKDPKQQQKQWQAFIDEVNKNGGVLGRKIKPYYLKVDVTSQSSQQAACTTFTETYHVFAVLAGDTGVSPECLVLQHRTLDIKGFNPFASPALVRGAHNLLISQGPTGSRLFADWARALEKLGKLKGRKLGLIVHDVAKPLTDAALVPTLRSMGYTLTYTAVISSSDASKAPSEAAAQAPQMKAAGVDTVLDAVDFLSMSSFVNAADKQRWTPQYLVSNYGSGDVGLFYSGMPDSWKGALAISYYPLYGGKSAPERAIERDCRMRYNKQTGDSMQRGDANISLLVGECTDLGLFVRAARSAGANLTRGGLSDAVQGFGNSFAYVGLGGSFSPGKTDWADWVRPMVWGANDGSSDPGGSCDSNATNCFNYAGPAFNP